jgi:hypothetical protein
MNQPTYLPYFISKMLLMGDGSQMSAMYEDEVDIMVDDDGRLYA